MDAKKRAEALAFLRSHNTGVLATCGKDGEPHASAIFYVADEKFNIHFLTLFNSRKYKALKENFNAKKLGTTKVKGKNEELQIYTVDITNS